MGAFDDLVVQDAPAADGEAGAFDDLTPQARGGFDDLVPKGEFSDLVPAAPASDRTRMSQLAVKVPEVISDWGLDFPKEIPGLSAADVEVLNSVKREQVLKEASRRVKESPGRAALRGVQQFAVGAASSLQEPENLGLIAAGAIAPPVAAGVMAGLAAKAIGEGAGTLSVPGVGTEEAVKQVLNTALMTAGGVGGAGLMKGPKAALKPGGSVSEFGGVPAEIPPPSIQPELENVAPGATVSEVLPVIEAKAPETTVAGAPAIRVNSAEIATRPDLMQFKRMDETQSGVNAQDKLQGEWDDLKGGNLLLWEPADPAAHGLEPGQKYIVANGHHRFEFGERKGVGEYNAQVIREADGYSAQDARALAAEINIADGKGTIYDQVKFLRNEAATHGQDAAVARAGRTGAKGRQAQAIAFQAGPDLFHSFINERVTPEQAEAIAKAAPIGDGDLNAGLQRLGVSRAMAGAGPAELHNLMQAVRLEAKGQTSEQFDLFGADDTALKTAEQLAKVAGRIQGELGREIRATESAAKNATTAKAKGVSFTRPPEEILAENERLKAERDKWDNWALHPELVAQVRGYAEMMRTQEGQAGLTLKEEYTPTNADRTLQGREQPGDTSGRDAGDTGKPAGEHADLEGTASAVQQATAPPRTAEAYAEEVRAMPDERLRTEVRLLEDDLRDATMPRSPNVFEGSHIPGENIGRIYSPEQLAEQAKGRESLAERTRAKLAVAEPELNRREAKLRGDLIKLRDNPRWVELQRKKEGPRYSRTGWPGDGMEPERNLTSEEAVELQQLEAKILDPVKAWLDRAIEATDLNRGKTLEGVFGAPVWITKAAANGALRVVRAAYAASKDIAKALAAGLEHLRSLNLEGFEEGQARKWLQEAVGVRQRAETIESGDASAPVKEAVASDAIYEVRSFEQIQKEANDIVQQQGLDGAMATFSNPAAGLPLDTRAALGAKLERTLRTQELSARTQGKIQEAEALAQKQVELWRADAYGTELAQGLNARKLYDEMGPQAKLQQAQDLFDEAAKTEWERNKPSVDAVKQAIEGAHSDAVDGIRNDAAVNTAARAAVDDQVQKSTETHRAVVMDLAEPWANSEFILKHAREAVRAKADELLNRQPRPAGFTPAARLRQILDDLAQRAAGIAAGHYQGAEPTVPLADKLAQRLGIAKDQALRLAKQFDTEWARQMEAAKKALPRKIAQARVANERTAGTAPESTDSQVDAALRRQLRTMNVKLGQSLLDEAGRREATGKSVAERIVQTSGLTGAAADALRARLESRWAELLKAGANARLEQMERTGVPVTRKAKGLLDHVTELTRLGALSDAKWTELAKSKLGLPTLTDELRREIVRRANDLQKLPEGELREREASKLLTYIVQQRGLNWWDLPMSMYISNLLGGIKTPAKILFENGSLIAATTLTALRNPTLLAHPWELVAKPGLRGAGQGLLHSLEILRGGVVTGIRGEMARAASILEQRPLGRFDWLNIWKWPLRAVAAAHVPLFKPAWEMKQTAIAARVAESEGLHGRALTQRVADLMGQTEDRVAAARSQAFNELQTAGYFEPRLPEEGRLKYEGRVAREKLDLSRRVAEIITQGREASMPGSTGQAREHALHYTYLGKPYGFIGFVGEMVRNGIERARLNGQGLYGAAVKSQVPFTTVASNIINEHLNWTPLGIARAVLSHENPITERLGTAGKLYGKPITDPAARGDLYARSVAGTVLAYGLAQLVTQGIIRLTGPGPASAQARKQWRDAGGEPWSLEVGGRRYSYQNTPWASSLGVLGAWNDWNRFGKGEEADANTRLAFALKATASQALSLPMLTGLRDFLEATSQQQTGTGGAQLEKLFARTASTLAFPKWLRDVDQAFDPSLHDASGVAGMMASQVPFVRRENRPVLNRLGEPVERGVWSGWTGELPKDPVWRTIAEKNAFIPEPSRNQIVGDRKRGPDYYRAITPDELYDLVAESGPRIRARLERALETGTLINDKIYPPLSQAEPWQAQTVVRHIANEEEARAKSRLRF